MQVKKQQLELDMEQKTGSKSGKEYVKENVYCSACLSNLYAEYIIKNAGLDEAQARIKIAQRNIQSEVSQKEKHQYSILTHIYGI